MTETWTTVLENFKCQYFHTKKVLKISFSISFNLNYNLVFKWHHIKGRTSSNSSQFKYDWDMKDSPGNFECQYFYTKEILKKNLPIVLV